MANQLNTAMLFAAGLGTRLKPFTDNHPKALAIVNNKTLLQRNIEYLQKFGIQNIVVNVHHFSNQIIDIINEHKGWGANVLISDETDEVLETGGGLKKAIPLFNNEENIVVMNVDILTNLDLGKMYQYHLENNAAATLAVTKRETSRYLIFSKENKLVGWMNSTTNEIKGITFFDKDLHRKFAFSGVHIINKKLLQQITQTGKFSMIDVYLNLMAENEVIGFEHSADLLLDVGTQKNIEFAEKIFV
ncbi:MAG: nucleotidyltransferase family protein [Bacteroidetes bacterium]|nr:nucleotidyltransferase family protein [Bacteroidota bacterium]